MPEMQGVINVHGGLVQAVFASEPLAELVVADWDVAPGDHQTVEVEMGQRPLRASVQQLSKEYEGSSRLWSRFWMSERDGSGPRPKRLN